MSAKQFLTRDHVAAMMHPGMACTPGLTCAPPGFHRTYQAWRNAPSEPDPMFGRPDGESVAALARKKLNNPMFPPRPYVPRTASRIVGSLR